MLVELLEPAEGHQTGSIIDVRDAFGTSLVRANKARYVVSDKPDEPEEVLAAKVATERAGIAAAQVAALEEQLEHIQSLLVSAKEGAANADKLAANAKLKCDQFLARQEAAAKARLADNAAEVAKQARQVADEAAASTTVAREE